MTSREPVDAVVVGSGLAGSSFALAAARAGLRVAIVEAQESMGSEPPVPFDLRVYALSLGSVRFLTRLDVWRRLDPERWEPFREMRVWDSGTRSHLHFDASEVRAPMLGAIVEDWAIRGALENALKEFPTVVWFRPGRLVSLEERRDSIEVTLDTAELSARLVVGADGTRSAVRAELGIGSKGGSYGQCSIVTMVKTERSHMQTAWQRFLPGGVVAFLPLPGPYCSIVWTVDEQEVDALTALDDSSFAAALREAFEGRLGNIEWLGDRVTFPLVWSSVHRYISGRAALIGDSAHTIHPLAGQGVNLGLMDAASLAELIARAHCRGRDVGAESCLRRYERWRKAHNNYVEGAMATLLWWFGQQTPGWRLLRGLGVSATQSIPGATSLFSRLAMGLTGDLPKSYEPLSESLREGGG